MKNDSSARAQLVPDYITQLQIYQSGRPIEDLAREKGLTRISKLASNENPLGPSPFAIKEMTAGLWNLHQYPDQHAYRLKTALSNLYNLKKENIILGNGSEGIMAYIVRTFILPGEEVITSQASFIGFNILAKGAGANIKTAPLTSDYRYDVVALAKLISEKTKIVYIANPNNPTGTYITKDEFDHLMKSVPDHCLVILDEAYFEFACDHDDYPDSMTYRYDNVITLRTFSKAYGIAGIRVGYGFAHEYLIENLTKVKLPFEPNLIAQLGAVGALQDRFHLERTLINNALMMDETSDFLTNHGFETIPSVTNFLVFKVPTQKSAEWLFNALLDEGVIIRPLASNGMPNFLRVSMGSETEMQHFFESMDKLVPAFKKTFGAKKS